MRGLEGWFARRVLVTASLAAVLAASAFLVSRAEFGPAADPYNRAFSVTFEHYGVDGREIERSITEPLENELASIPGIKEIRSTSELGRCRVVLFAAPDADESDTYLAVRDAVERVYRGMPRSVQKPQIYASGSSQRPVFVASLEAPGLSEAELRSVADREIKPALGKLKGAGEIEIGGGGVEEIRVEVDPERAAARGLDYASVADGLRGLDLLAPLGFLRSRTEEEAVVLSGRAGTVEALSAMSIRGPSGPVRLSDVATVRKGNRESEGVSRVDGKSMIVLYVQSAGSANLIALSRSLRAALDGWAGQGITARTILDRGEELESSVRSVASAMIQGILLVAAVLPMFIRGKRRLAAMVLSMPAIALVSAAAVAGSGIAIDQYILAGFAVGIGTILDTGVIVSEQRDLRRLSLLVPSLASSLATTLIVLVPLASMEFAAPGIKQISFAMGAMLLVSFAISVLYLPLAYGKEGQPETGIAFVEAIKSRIRARFARPARRLLYRCAILGERQRRPILAFALLLALLAAYSALELGKDFSALDPGSTLEVHLEFESGASLESTDARALAFSKRVRDLPGVVLVESNAKRGSADLQVKFDPERAARKDLGDSVRSLGRDLPGGFVYLPDGGSGERSIEIALLGDDDARLRDLAKATAAAFGEADFENRVVLNFKEPPEIIILRADNDRESAAGISTAQGAAALHWALRGPVALKWIEKEREFDLRVMAKGSGSATRASLLALPLRTSQGVSVSVGDVFHLETEREPSRIYRKNRQRAVFLTVQAPSGSVDEAVAHIWSVLDRVKLPPGYAFDLDESVTDLDRSFKRLWFAFATSILLVYLVLAAAAESATAPLVVLSILPTSLAFPLAATLLAGAPLRTSSLIGYIMLVGMVVNSSILVVDEIRERCAAGASPRAALPRALRLRASPLFITAVLTILGSLPLLFAGGGDGFMRELSLVILLGVAGALVSTLFILPAVVSAFPGAFRPRRGLIPGINGIQS
jgi:HAE1 family hydrophobic/amphiphilic exporter-1